MSRGKPTAPAARAKGQPSSLRSANSRASTLITRAFSPSAEVRGHGPGQEVLQVVQVQR